MAVIMAIPLLLRASLRRVLVGVLIVGVVVGAIYLTLSFAGASQREFVAALIEGKGSIERLTENACRLTSGDTSAAVIFAGEAQPVVVDGIETDAECAFVQYEGGQPSYACVIAGKRLAIDGKVWLDAPEPTDSEPHAP